MVFHNDRQDGTAANVAATASAVKETQRLKVEMPRAEQWVMRSNAENRAYQIKVAQPPGDPPPGGYPVVYLLDANSVFGTMVEALRLQSRRPDKTGVVPAIVVGIGYETEEPFAPERFYDLTPKPTTEYLRRPDGTALPEQGGAGHFLQFIEEELKPHLEREFKIDRKRQAIFGHSLGGLFVLYAFLTKPDAFQYYIAGSPSIHWNKQYLLAQEREFAARLAEDPVGVRLLLAFGELEKSHISRNCDSAEELAERLSGLSGHGVNAEFKLFEDENHVSVLPVLISRALRFALSP